MPRCGVPPDAPSKPASISGFGRFLDRCFDLVHGTETRGLAETADMAVVGPHRAHGVGYQPTRARALRRVLRDLRLPPGQVFVDLGCGKGRVLLIALEFGFAKIVGVEYAPALCEAATRNLAVARWLRGRGTPVVVHCLDAADYDFGERETVVYLFNPFDAVVLERVMLRLGDSLRREPRRLWLIYMFPRWHERLDGDPLLAFAGLHEHDGCQFAVYTHEPRAGAQSKATP